LGISFWQQRFTGWFPLNAYGSEQLSPYCIAKLALGELLGIYPPKTGYSDEQERQNRHEFKFIFLIFIGWSALGLSTKSSVKGDD